MQFSEDDRDEIVRRLIEIARKARADNDISQITTVWDPSVMGVPVRRGYIGDRELLPWREAAILTGVFKPKPIVVAKPKRQRVRSKPVRFKQTLVKRRRIA